MVEKLRTTLVLSIAGLDESTISSSKKPIFSLGNTQNFQLWFFTAAKYFQSAAACKESIGAGVVEDHALKKERPWQLTRAFAISVTIQHNQSTSSFRVAVSCRISGFSTLVFISASPPVVMALVLCCEIAPSCFTFPVATSTSRIFNLAEPLLLYSSMVPVRT